MIFDKLIEKKLKKKYNELLERKASDLWNLEQRMKIVNVTIKIINLITLIGTSIAIIYLFKNIIYIKYGFEETIILLLTIIFIKIMNK